MNPAQIVFNALESRVGIEHFIPNAILLLPVPAPGTYADPVTGNEIPNQTVLRVTAYAKQDGDFGKAKASNTPGGPEIIEQLRGFCISPRAVPKGIPSIDWIPAYVSGRRGELHWAPRTAPAFQMDQILGAKFFGKFVRYSGQFFEEETIQSTPYTLTQAVDPIEAMAAIPQYSAVIRTSDRGGRGKAAPFSSADPLGIYRVIGLSPVAVAVGDPVEPITIGNLTDPDWAWTPGAKLYLADDGTISETPGTTVFPMGLAITATNINVFVGFPE
jgi:hypothetical protein